jgi:PEGA domain
MGRRMPPPPPDSPDNTPTQRNEARSDYGTLNIRVQPMDAEVSVDGAAWRGPAGQDGLTIDLAEGSHTVEVRKPGFRTYVTQVDIHRGQATDLNVSLRNE